MSDDTHTNADLIDLPPAERMEAVLAFIFRGIHHCDKLEKHDDECWRTKASTLATFDFDELTRLVVAAHEYGVRVQISPCNPQYVRITLHARKSRDGGFSQRHPTIDQMLKSYGILTKGTTNE